MDNICKRKPFHYVYVVDVVAHIFEGAVSLILSHTEYQKLQCTTWVTHHFVCRKYLPRITNVILSFWVILYLKSNTFNLVSINLLWCELNIWVTHSSMSKIFRRSLRSRPEVAIAHAECNPVSAISRWEAIYHCRQLCIAKLKLQNPK